MKPWDALNNAEIIIDAVDTSRSFWGNIIAWIRIIGTGAAIVGLTIISFFYLTAEAPQKAHAKERLINFTIGAAVFFGATSVIAWLGRVIEEILEGVL